MHQLHNYSVQFYELILSRKLQLQSYHIFLRFQFRECKNAHSLHSLYNSMMTLNKYIKPQTKNALVI